MAKFRLRKFKGKVIAVTGSVGKSSTKEAIFTVLNSQFKVKKSDKSMNTDFGLPLSILDIESGYTSFTKWSWFLLKGLYNCLFRDHSDVLLLEFGVDKPRDMNFLLSMVKPDIAVVTSVAPAHFDRGQFKNVEDVFEEKKKIVDALGENGIAVLNIDNPFLEKLAKTRSKKNTITFGKNKDADFYASRIIQSSEGLNFLVHRKEEKYEVKADVLGEFQIYALLPALICAEIMKMDMAAAVMAISRYTLPPGRMSIIPAKEGAVIIDSSYNSSPEALKEALKVLKSAGEGRKVAVLGNMNELGDESRAFHEMIGEIIPEYADELITVGSDAKNFGKNMDEKHFHSFDSAMDAAGFFKDKIKKGDIILVKGSQNNVRLERFVKEFMLEPEKAKELLVRQEMAWEERL